MFLCDITDGLMMNFVISLSLSNGATARGGPRPPSRVSSIFPGLGHLVISLPDSIIYTYIIVFT